MFRRHGAAYRDRNAGHLSRGQRKVMGAVESCRTAALGGHVERCGDCGHTAVSFNSCRNRHCPKCQAGAARDWLAARQVDLLPVPYFHVVFNLPAPIAAIAYQNKADVYAMLFEAVAETLRIIAGDPKHLGAEIGMTMVLHTWGQTLSHHPHVHCIVPGGGLSPDHSRWIGSRPGFFLPVRVLSRLYRRLFLEKLVSAHGADKLRFFGDHAALADTEAFAAVLAPLRRDEWVVFAKRPFAGPEQVLAYLSRYTHRIAIANRRLVAMDDSMVSFTWKDYRQHAAPKTMTLAADEFMRRFLLHVLPDGFQRIRHYGFLANGHRKTKLALIRKLLNATAPHIAMTVAVDQPADGAKADSLKTDTPTCTCCGGTMAIIEILPGPRQSDHRQARRSNDTS